MSHLLRYRTALRAVAALLLLATPAARPDSLPMWEVNGAANRVAILGSIHFLKPGRDPLPAAVVEAYQNADVVVMEIDLDDLDAAAAQASLNRLGIDPQARTLQQIMRPGDFAAARAKAQAAGIDLDLLQGFEPWLAALTVTQLRLASLGYDANAGVERQVLEMAQRDRKEIRGLETVEQQFNAMDRLPLAAQSAFLLETLDDAATMEEQVDTIVTAWKQGDIRRLETEFLHGLKAQPDLYRRIVVNRNRDWAGKLNVLLRDRHDYLVVVGTLHLVGPDSLIRMLEHAGYAPRQVMAPAPGTLH
ncbi:MAG: hypothetical protein AMXMBFR45_21760 [Gammaproteobacteria bacterium]|nr:MAG: TraB/GumN family protein [Pseudomonadota bacterium]MBC6946181.1 TraB/GumN family protein [Gammaproteobacteria bacterium]MCE7895897.1 TraB/GumN family protein [Gammaproteobacteria bacterium PRO8]MDL1881230.1 TraB/GumN family protein [Gammaproteobacteria bacterium PRO2]MCL4777986.1 TraB/GumN family protein [Gammaproteobacteria bacterium]